MQFIGAGYSDVGNIKEINQDSMMIKISRFPGGQAACGIVCDGMGGLKSGEVASASVIRKFSDWFNTRLPEILSEADCIKIIQKDWDGIVQECNKKIMDYGKQNGFNIGTTVTGICIIENRYITINVGDSRVYMLDSGVRKITRDQTFVEMEIAAGRMTKQEAERDSRRNVLLQCVGASSNVVPDFTFGEIKSNTAVIICSDGFRHKINESEMYSCLAPQLISDSKTAEEYIKNLIQVIKKRGERDNITAALIKTVCNV